MYNYKSFLSTNQARALEAIAIVAGWIELARAKAQPVSQVIGRFYATMTSDAAKAKYRTARKAVTQVAEILVLLVIAVLSEVRRRLAK